MAKVTVHGFTVNDQGKDIKLPSKRTVIGIQEVGGTLLFGTAQSVETSELRDDGRYMPARSEEPPEAPDQQSPEDKPQTQSND
jgi:hypothetical protein